MIGQITNVEINRGSVLVNQRNDDWDGWGMTLGPYINGKNIEFGSNMYWHEYGHTIQSRIFGPLYVSRVGVPSLMTASYGSYHDRTWYEVWANRLAGVPESYYYPRELRSKKWWYWALMIGLPFLPN
jgi:hypothetical protein